MTSIKKASVPTREDDQNKPKAPPQKPPRKHRDGVLNPSSENYISVDAQMHWIKTNTPNLHGLRLHHTNPRKKSGKTVGTPSITDKNKGLTTERKDEEDPNIRERGAATSWWCQTRTTASEGSNPQDASDGCNSGHQHSV